MENKKVHFPCYSQVEFKSLEEAVNYVQKIPGDLYLYISDIVMYNVRFRDCLRKSGVKGVVKMLVEEAPAIVLDKEAIDSLKRRAKRGIADYDIQCLPKDGPICIDGHQFDGLADIEAQVEMSGSLRYTYSKWTRHKKYTHNPSGLHVGNIWDSYPIFDPSDLLDNRSYNNYVFSRNPITEAMMDAYRERVGAPFNSCMVHEDIPEDLLPVLYYNGDSDYILLATKKA